MFTHSIGFNEYSYYTASGTNVLKHKTHEWRAGAAVVGAADTSGASGPEARTGDLSCRAHHLFTADSAKIASPHRSQTDAKITISILVNHFEKRRTKWRAAHEVGSGGGNQQS